MIEKRLREKKCRGEHTQSSSGMPELYTIPPLKRAAPIFNVKEL